MKTSLSHLPDHKQEELTALTRIITENTPAEMVILFGSHARGDWVEDFQENTEYVSDYDILVITNDRKSAKDGEIWWNLGKKLSGNEENTRTTIIQHSIGFVNDKIERNQYFFIDILKEGIVLFDSGKCKLAEPKNLNIEERQAKASDDFKQWFNSANDFRKYAELATQNSDNNFAVFNLHQATERYYATILLVFTEYKPKIHDIEKLGKQVEKLHSIFGTVFAKNTPQEKRLFELLQKAYIDSRYNMNYKIEKTELEYLGERVRLLRDLTERICRERIAEMQNSPSS